MAAIAEKVRPPVTPTGCRRLHTSEPSPRSPETLKPQQYAAPPVVSPQVYAFPAVRVENLRVLLTGTGIGLREP
jgi:hypothetical protein